MLEQICVRGAIAIPSASAPSSALSLGSALVFEKVIELERAIVLESDIAAEAAIPLESAIVLEGAIALAHAIAFTQVQLHWRVQKNLVLPSRSCANAHPNAILFLVATVLESAIVRSNALAPESARVLPDAIALGTPIVPQLW